MQLESDDDGAMEISDDEVWESDDDDEDGPPIPALQPHPRDLDNFMLMCRALRLFLSDELTFAQVDQADTLLRQYCCGLLEVRVATFNVSGVGTDVSATSCMVRV